MTINMRDFLLKEAEERLERIMACLDRGEIRTRIEIPMEIANYSFDHSIHESNTGGVNTLLVEAMGRLVQHIYRTGVQCPLSLSQSQAEAHALRLLEDSYQGRSGNGFDAAHYDVCENGTEGLSFVLSFLGDVILMNERSQYTQNIMTLEVDSLSWGKKVALTRAIAEYLVRMNALDVTEGHPDRFANCIPLLIPNLLEIRAELRHGA